LSCLLFGDRSAATVRSTKQVMPSVELNSTDGQKPEIGDG
jgi:hypothetical protein